MTPIPSSSASTADFGSRFSAFMIDALLLFAGQWIVFIVLSRQLQSVGLTSTEPCVPNGVQLCQGPSTFLWIVLISVLLISTIGYYAFFEGRFGSSPGKRWMGLVVVDEQGRWPIGLGAGLLRAVLRQALWLVPFVLFDVSPFSISLPAILFVLLPLVAIGVLVPAVLAVDGRGIHDRVAKTRVVHKDHASGPKAESVDLDADLSMSVPFALEDEEPRPDPEDDL